MKTILFPTDFSSNAEIALQFALDFALKSQSDLVLLNVIPIPYDFATKIDEAITSLDDFSKKSLKNKIKDIEQNSKYARLKVKGVTMVGGLISSILEYCQENPVELIIMGTKGATGLKKIIFGTNTTEIIRRSSQPVLVVPEDAAFERLDKIIYAIDYEEDGLEEIHEMLEVVKPLDLEIQTVHVSTSKSLKEEILHQGLRNLLETRFPESFKKHDLIFNKSVFGGMEGYLDQNSTGLLVMTHHKKPFLSSLLSKNKTTEMTYQTHMPLLILE